MTKLMREAWIEAFDRRGGVEYLLKLDDAEFVKGLVKMIPSEVSARLGEVEIVHRIHVGPKPE